MEQRPFFFHLYIFICQFLSLKELILIWFGIKIFTQSFVSWGYYCFNSKHCPWDVIHNSKQQTMGHRKAQRVNISPISFFVGQSRIVIAKQPIMRQKTLPFFIPLDVWAKLTKSFAFWLDPMFNGLNGWINKLWLDTE